MYYSDKKIIVISAINFFEGGPLSILKDCLGFLDSSELSIEYQIIGLIHNKCFFTDQVFKRVRLIEFPRSRKSYFYRIFYEFYYFKKLSVKLQPIFWFSLHDISPNVGSIPQAVYCHNPAPFNSIIITDLFVQPKQLFFRLFYKFLYQINIRKNIKVVVQQQWMAKEFQRFFGLDKNKILVSIPEISFQNFISRAHKVTKSNQEKSFIFPTYPRPFKNLELVCKAVRILNERNINNFRVLITIDGSENRYAKKIYERYFGIKNLCFIGLKTRYEIFELYREADCLLFPSKLETWGLPISEFKNFGKSIFVSNLPYAHETLNGYEKAFLFDPSDEYQLADAMNSFIIDSDNFKYSKSKVTDKIFKEVSSWENLFKILIPV
jgi:glycosyltransferase involved in cell wall biosynthesis